MSRWKNNILNGLGDNYFYEAVETIKTVSAEELKSLANKYLLPENFYELVVI
jgi:predicted Zn-dependent peptidase